MGLSTLFIALLYLVVKLLKIMHFMVMAEQKWPPHQTRHSTPSLKAQYYYVTENMGIDTSFIAIFH